MSRIPIVTREHVLMALAAIDRDSVPPHRGSTGYVLLANRSAYPPKYVLAQAVKYATGKELLPSEFSGGEQTNSILRNLGFTIEPLNPRQAHTEHAPQRQPGQNQTAQLLHAVVTVVLETHGTAKYDFDERLITMSDLLAAVRGMVTCDAVIVFPGGWIKAGPNPPKQLLTRVEEEVPPLLRQHRGTLAVTFGLDGRKLDKGNLDQLAVAVTDEGIVGIGRKFYPAPRERPRLAASWDQGEGGYSRVPILFGKRYYLAVCYDAFGIKRLDREAALADAVLDHVHGFARKGKGDSGDVLFARHGFAGAAQAWHVPVFAAATFFDRPVPPAWPSGVVWVGPPASTRTWTYAKNGLAPSQEIHVPVSEGIAHLRIFGPGFHRTDNMAQQGFGERQSNTKCSKSHSGWRLMPGIIPMGVTNVWFTIRITPVAATPSVIQRP